MTEIVTPTSEPCTICGAVVHWKKPPKSARLPSGWKRRENQVYCGKCWMERFILRAVTIPVASPLDCTWEELNKRLHSMWAATTTASNWMTTEFYVRDIRREPQATKLPPMPRVYLYPEARQRFPMLPSQSVASLEQAMGAKYRAKRYEIIWTCAASLPSYRYPTPFGIPNQGWSVDLENNQPIVSVRIGDERMRLRLRGGGRFVRQLRAVRQIVSGQAQQGQMDIYRQGHGKTAQVMVKMVAWLPRGVSQPMEGTLIVKSTPDAILQAFNLKDEVIWTYHGDQLRRWVAEHNRLIQRLADDSKAELRPVPPFARSRTLAVERFHRRMKTASHAIAAMLIGYARRRKFAGLQYDDRDQSFGEGLPWADLRLKVMEKADAAGITFLGYEVVPENAVPLTEG